ncbi:MAG: hypothetical protein EXS15_08300 [Phycisphaerales bacterium]|nr:hypothetical protein [Phycisphaerales bacterium]
MIPHIPSILSLALFAQSPVATPPVREDPARWRAAEHAQLSEQTQLTFPDRFFKAGEAYFSPDGGHIIFQAVEKPAEGEKPADFYAMFVADLSADASGAPRLTHIRRVSPPDSANTCGWFDASRSNMVIFGSTLVAPKSQDVPGFQRGSGKYRWQFPPEMRVVEVNFYHPEQIAAGSAKPAVIAGDGTAYIAECTTTRDGKHLLFCTLAAGQGDISVKNLKSGIVTPLIVAPGYDGGPFFSPDERHICYRSDRKGDSLLQVYISEIVRNEQGEITGATNERQLTANEYVNWAPYWHPSVPLLIYASSEIGHTNYEIFSVEVPAHGSSHAPIRGRVTHADGADVLPVFDGTGQRMMWTSQRGEGRSSQLWIANVVVPTAQPASQPASQPATPVPTQAP